MAGSRAAAEHQNFGYTPEELTFTGAVKDRVKKLVTPEKGSVGSKTKEYEEKQKKIIDEE